MSTVISQKTKNHVAPVAEIIDQPALKRGKTDDFADMVTEHAPSLSDNDLQPLKAIYNAKARRKKYIRGRAANNVQWVYEKRSQSTLTAQIRTFLNAMRSRESSRRCWTRLFSKWLP